MTKLLVGFFGGLIVAVLFANFTYFEGFDDGADAALCVFAHQVDGPKVAMQSRSCLNIKGRTPPPRIFGGESRE